MCMGWSFASRSAVRFRQLAAMHRSSKVSAVRRFSKEEKSFGLFLSSFPASSSSIFHRRGDVLKLNAICFSQLPSALGFSLSWCVLCCCCLFALFRVLVFQEKFPSLKTSRLQLFKTCRGKREREKCQNSTRETDTWGKSSATCWQLDIWMSNQEASVTASGVWS